MMGVLLGDGCLNGSGVTVSNPTFDHDIMDRLERIKPKDFQYIIITKMGKIVPNTT